MSAASVTHSPQARYPVVSDSFDPELERRLQLLEDPESSEKPLENLPVKDFAWAVGGLVVLSIALLVWGYPR